MATAKWIAMAVISLGASTQALADEADLSGRARGLGKSLEASSAPAPFMRPAEVPVPSIVAPPPSAAEHAARCADALRSFCYEARERGLVYRGARDYMPRMGGLTPEGVALRRDRLTLRYSF